MFKILHPSPANDTGESSRKMVVMNTINLGVDQIEFYKEQGYLSIERLTTPEDVAMLRESYDRIFRERAGRNEGNQFDLAGTDEEGKEASLPQILNPGKYAPEMNKSLLLSNATRVAKQLFGEAATCTIGHAIFKPARVGPPTPWHQDAAYWSPDLDYPSTVSIWVPLQDTPVETGCMWFVPASHRSGDIWQHQSIGNDPRVHGLELHADEMHRTASAVACPLGAGGCTIHGGYTLHYTGPNISDVPRRALILSAGLPATRRSTPRELPWEKQKQTARAQRSAAASMK
jgi:ectoine hydroxylase-related dioxygenase (phytanoyl-CoA dioxygenase family)